MQGRRKVGAWGSLALQCLAKQLTLSQPGGQIMPTTVLKAPLDFQILRLSWSLVRPSCEEGRKLSDKGQLWACAYTGVKIIL